MNTSLNIVILAAGLGTRMKSSHAKVLHRAGGRTLIEHVVGTALELVPPERIFVVVGHHAEDVRKAVNVPGVHFIVQTEQKGTGHAVLAGRDVLAGLGGYLMVLYGDCPLLRAATLQRLVDTETKSAAAGTILTAFMEDPTGYGRVLRDASGNVFGVVEQKAGTPEQLALREANMGIYCYRAEAFWKHAGEIEPNNPAHEYYLTDMVEILVRHGFTVEAMRIDDAREVLGINNRVELAEVDALFRSRKVREAMLAGVTVEKPETVTIDAGVRIGPDTIIGPFAQLLGNTVIGSNCRIGACSIVSDSTLGDDVEVGPFSIVNASTMERGSHAGPYSRMRFDNHLGEGAQVGNFVELKKTSLGPGAKALHLAYLGDATIGANTNIGAGTITCNYDGKRKHPTTIGDGAFVGSNSTLVAPVEIQTGAYVGAGSVITAPVPSGSLALGRARQVVKEGWCARRRETPAAPAGEKDTSPAAAPRETV